MSRRRNLQVYDSLWENHPRVKQLRAEIAAGKAQGRAEGRAEGVAKGKVEALQHAIVAFVRSHYPALTELAQQKVAHMNKPDALDYLLEQIYAQRDEDGVRPLLLPTVA